MERSSRSDDPHPLTMPRWLRDVPIRRLLPLSRPDHALDRTGLHTVGEAARLTEAGLRGRPGIDPKTARFIRRTLVVLSQWEKPDLPRLAEQDGPVGLPKVPLLVLKAVLEAGSVDDEVEALMEGMSPRDADFFLRRMRCNGCARPSLEGLGGAWDVTRERVRQIVEMCRSGLHGSGLHLPRASGLVDALDASGGTASTCEIEVLAASSEIGGVDPEILCMLPALSELGLVPEIEHHPEIDLWVTGAGRRAWFRSGRLEESITALKGEISRSLELVSCVDESRLVDSVPLPYHHYRSTVEDALGPFEKHHGFLVPIPTSCSVLTRSVEKMLAVTPRLRLDEVTGGLQRLQRRLRDVPPAAVVGRVLCAHSSFDVEGATIRPAAAFPWEDALSNAERALLDLLVHTGGRVTYDQVVHEIESVGFSKFTGQALLGGPFLERIDLGVYTARGWNGRASSAPT